MKGDLNSVVNWVMHHLLGYSCNLYTSFHRVFIVVTNHQLDLPVDLETCVRLEIILLNEA